MSLTIDKLEHALAADSDRLVLDKASISSQAAGTYISLWRATGQPGQGAIPGAAAVCDNSLVGCFGTTDQTSPKTGYLAQFEWASGNAGSTIEIHDRLVHMGGLSGTIGASSQTVGIDLSTLLSTSNLANRIGSSAYDDVQWWLEWYSATGSTAVTATASATLNDGSSVSLTGLALAATRPASFMASLNSLIPAANSGKYIRGISGLTLSATTGTAGSFGITATRLRGSVTAYQANVKYKANWADLPISEVPTDSCLFPIVLTTTTSSGTARGGGKVAHMDPS